MNFIKFIKVDWAALAKNWMDMQQNVLFNEIQFLHSHPANQVLLPRPPMQFNNFSNNFNDNFNLPFTPPPLPQNHLPFHPMISNLNQPQLNQFQFDQPFNPPFNQTFNHQPPLITTQIPNFIPNNRKDPPLLPQTFTINRPFNNEQNPNKFTQNKQPETNIDKIDLNDKINESESIDKPNEKNEDKRTNNDQISNNNHNNNHNHHHNRNNKIQRHLGAKDFVQNKLVTNQLQFNNNNNLKMNHLIPNQLDQESNTDAESNSIFDANKRKKLPEWIKEGLERMEKEKQKKIEREESLIKKAKEEQLRKELEMDNDEEEEDNQKEVKEMLVKKIEVDDKKKLFSSSGIHQKTFADMFLVKKAKDYYKNEEEREKELVINLK